MISKSILFYLEIKYDYRHHFLYPNRDLHTYRYLLTFTIEH